MGAGGRAPYTLHTVTLNSLVRNPTLRSAFRVQCALEVLCYARTRRRNCSPGATIRTGSYPYSAPTAWLLRSERGSRRAGRYDAAFGVGARRARPIAQETGKCRWVSLGPSSPCELCRFGVRPTAHPHPKLARRSRANTRIGWALDTITLGDPTRLRRGSH